MLSVCVCVGVTRMESGRARHNVKSIDVLVQMFSPDSSASSQLGLSLERSTLVGPPCPATTMQLQAATRLAQPSEGARSGFD